MNLQMQRAFLFAYGLVPELTDLVDTPGVELIECPHFDNQNDQSISYNLVKLLTYVDHDFLFAFGLCHVCGHGYHMPPVWDLNIWRQRMGLPRDDP